jgi:20S proteasome alpha/beta subunit
MTIAIGMKFNDGYLLAADTLVTVTGHYKMAQSKLRRLQTKSCRAFFAIAGDLEFTNRAIEIIDNYLDGAEPNKAHVLSSLEAACFDIHDRFSSYENCLQMLGIVCVKDVPPHFVTINGPIMSPAGTVNCIGSGEPLARFLLSQSYLSSTVTKEVALRTAAYILFNVKKHVDGCGGMSQFVAVSNDGSWHSPYTDEWTFEDLDELEKTFNRLDRHIRTVVPMFVAYDTSAANFATGMEAMKTKVCELRSAHLNKISDDEQAYYERQEEWYEQQALEDAKQAEEETDVIRQTQQEEPAQEPPQQSS